jgi:NAD(P)-dependent dehydrogenase (short-subunit alcohol dehydrogenase family)
MSQTQLSEHDLISRVAPVLRGLLAQRSNSEDNPAAPFILKSHADEDALAFAGGAKSSPKAVEASCRSPLRLDPLRGSETDEELRQQLGASLARYEQEHHAKPEVICLPRVAVFRVSPAPAVKAPGSALAGRVAMVTGAAGAIGYGIRRGLIDQGCHLAITDLPGERLDRFVDEFRKENPERCLGVPMDVTDPKSVRAGLASICAAWGGVDIVVLNAGIALACPLIELDLEAFRRLERVNVEGTLLVLADAGRHFARQKLGGDIILVSTKNVFSPGAGFGAYSATKAAAHQLARIASLEFAPLGVRVNMVAPDAVFSGGAHRSGLWAEVGPGRMKARGLDEKGLEEYYQQRNLLKAKVTAEHVANAVLFFATRQTPTTGACIPVDGGLPDATPR